MLAGRVALVGVLVATAARAGGRRSGCRRHGGGGHFTAVVLFVHSFLVQKGTAEPTVECMGFGFRAARRGVGSAGAGEVVGYAAQGDDGFAVAALVVLGRPGTALDDHYVG
ncbi:hypothetical protein Adu01nite_56720 [Paractinoplanes durhamensis]|uniref:Secreted protein n=1 Tax=Paractinoplanes durhamensis TaxID=113563 RepID=A0ABQ3Z3B9_9ACTN|nr:hypothetical protein Adu01nite_56720 [Actinoplanes durhamensis]